VKIKNIDHINISGPSDLIEQVAAFYIDILGLTAGERPQFSRPGYWLYASGAAIVHLTVDPGCQAGNNSHLNHVALSAEGLQKYRNHLAANKIPYQESAVKELKQTQLFLKDPADNGVELNFAEEI